MEEKHQNCKNSTQLDHDLKQLVKGFADIQMEHFLQQNQMSRGGHRQPFGDALDDAKQNGLQKFDHNITPLR